MFRQESYQGVMRLVIHFSLHNTLAPSSSTPSSHSLRTLNIQARIDLNPHARHTRILRQHHVRIRAVLQIRLVLEHRRIFETLNALGRELVALSPHC
jgi:hypothetical protein